ncbi:succinate dehydrogenase [Morganella morganii]|uniref:Succinate dehydrogenase hydrophobic membrane anchor subunit n=1 Tax=Morganella morganii TaxID=582 RepID=A0A0D8LA50_MORMO|nr:succinate dehydrogenase, hydrophobic membrane anchor protein [Morganella morganii]KJF78722.1 succinate dehydrogenase [Morganella morganii]
MVKNSKISATTLGRNGIQDWLILRASAIVITLYVLYLIGFVAFTSDITYDVWYGFFTASFTQVFTTLTLIAVLAHAWVGLWQVLTDYVKCLSLRLLLQFIIIIVLAAYVIYGSIIVWGV